MMTVAMKTVRLIVLAIVLCAAAPAARAQVTYALLAGISNYDNYLYPNLSYTTNDVKTMAKLLKRQTDKTTVITSKYATREAIEQRLGNICDKATEMDRIVFFFAGHGFNNGIVTYDKPMFYDDLVAILARSRANEIIVYLDVCHAGSMQNSTKAFDWNRGTKHPGMVFFLSSRPDEISIESSYVGNGYFSQALIKGLRGQADADNNHKVTVIELFKFAYNDVVTRSRGKQHPQLLTTESHYDSVLMWWNPKQSK